LADNANMAAKKSKITSLIGTFSLGKNKEKNQNKSIPPTNRQKVRKYGLIVSGINEREIGLFNPNKIFAANNAMCPLIALCSIIFLNDNNSNQCMST